MSNDFQQGDTYNPYHATPGSFQPPTPKTFNPMKVKAPAIALIVFGVSCMLATIYSLVNALISDPPVLPPDAPEFMVQMTKNTVGPTAAAIQSVFVLVALFILVGGIQMLRLKSWGIALAASIVSMVNFSNCCCILGLPIGVWALVVLLMADVKQAFSMSANQ